MARYLSVVLVLLGICLSLASGADDSFITINGKSLSKEDFYARLENVPVQTTKGDQKITVPAGQYVVQQMIGEMLIEQLARKEGVTATDAQVDRKIEILTKYGGEPLSAILAREGVTEQEYRRRKLMEQTLVNLTIKGIDITDAEVRQAYSERSKLASWPFNKPEAVRISVILTKERAKIDEAYGLLKQGKPFPEVAKQISEDKNTAPDGGVVGWLDQGFMKVPQIVRNVTFGLQTGKFSDPFRVEDGKDSAWVIVRADMKRPAQSASYDEIKDLLREQLAAEKASKENTFSKLMKSFIESSQISVSSDQYKGIVDTLKKDASGVQESIGTAPAGE